VYRLAERNYAVGPRLTHLVSRGFIAVAFGLGCFGLTTVSLFLPRVTTAVLDLVFGSYALVDGVVALAIGAGAAGSRRLRPAMLLRGIFGLVAALFSFHAPMTTPLASAHVIGGWALLTGLLDLGTAIARGQRDRLGSLGWAGVMAIITGILLLTPPDVWILLLLFVVGLYLVVAGVFLLAFVLRRAGF
jgi:uncharacterized membrane protein HdeD (DUF308 family)